MTIVHPQVRQSRTSTATPTEQASITIEQHLVLMMGDDRLRIAKLATEVGKVTAERDQLRAEVDALRTEVEALKPKPEETAGEQPVPAEAADPAPID